MAQLREARPLIVLHPLPSYHTILYHIISYHTISFIPYHIIPYHTVPNHTILYHTIPCSTISYHTIPCNTISPRLTILPNHPPVSASAKISTVWPKMSGNPFHYLCRWWSRVQHFYLSNYQCMEFSQGSLWWSSHQQRASLNFYLTDGDAS